MTYFVDPFRHYWPLPDRKTICWSPNLAQTVTLENADLWPLLQQLRSSPEGPIRPQGDLLAVARFLHAQGYFRSDPSPEMTWDRNKLPASGPKTRIWEFFDLPGWLAQTPSPTGECLHVFAGDGQGQGWCFWEAPGRVCVRCQVLRWLANRGLSQSIKSISEACRAWPGLPAWEAFTGRTQAMLLEARRCGSSLYWEQDQVWICRPVALPGCPCAQALEAGSVEEFLPEPTPEWSWLNPLGVVCQTSCDGGPLWLWGARSGELALLGGLDPERSQGAGCHPDRQTSLRQAVGETLERYCARWSPPEAPADHQPLLWREFSAQQLRQSNFGYQDSGPIQHWGQVYPLAGGDPRRVPAQALLLCDLPGEPALYPGLSHGLCCHRTLPEALWGALWECLERDAVASWWAQLCSSRGLPAQARRHPLEIQPDPEVEVALYEIPCLTGHCAVAWAVTPEGRRAGGAAASLDLSCLTKAVQESLHNARCMVKRDNPEPPPELPVTFRQHLETYWDQPQRFPQSRLDSLNDRFSPILGESSPDSIADRLAQLGLHLYWANLTTPDVASLGYQVVKVFSPDLLYLPAQHRHWPLGRKRYRALVGHNQAPRLPHPFA